MFVLHDYETNYGEHCREDWRRIVVEYSRRNLSVESDKLPALAGLAARFSLDSIHNGTSLVAGNRYLAGLWLDDMIRDLCWSLDIYKQPILRPQQYCAPSWSWASVNGPIDYKEWARFFTELAVLKDAYVNLESRDQAYGRVIGGWILLRGLKLRPYKKQDSKSLWIRDNGVVFRVVSTWDSEAYEVPEEGQLPYPDGGTTELFLIPLGWVKRHTLALNNGPDALLGPFFLIVKPATHEAQRYACVPGFKRVGFGTGVWLTNANEGTDKAGLERLIVERFFAAKQRGELEDIVLI
ncbi:hypothetical protein QQS21_011242 [Conoideocrella luteorostrata]|uniref:Heterokaryon incompatibility domain-containing protein n=1 Tax=Conoideocrella luteorostrata TaxID=1105319 RepID=A0AAJ0CI00_9HYPO|nr:hypothetical protein QQS21_011242 [Conoideocrella luteorostrata]